MMTTMLKMKQGGDLEVEEDIGGDVAFDGAAVEQLDDKYKAKWDRYVLEKESLIEEARKVKCNPPNHQKLDIGVEVKERRSGRVGFIMADDRDDGHACGCYGR